MTRPAVLISLLALSLISLGASSADQTPLNAAMVKYCESKLGKRVGSGECAHLANEALRVSGAEFTRAGPNGKAIPDSPDKGDYVWGELVKTYSFDDKQNKLVDSMPKAKCQPGDIMQYRDVKLGKGTTAHHTAIVRTVDDNGNITGIYQQNAPSKDSDDKRTVSKADFQVLKMSAGKIWVYRPVPPQNPSPVQYNIINNSDTKTVEYLFTGTTHKLGEANTADGFRCVWATGKTANILVVDGSTYRLAPRMAYEFYTTKDGKIALREVK